MGMIDRHTIWSQTVAVKLIKECHSQTWINYHIKWICYHIKYFVYHQEIIIILSNCISIA